MNIQNYYNGLSWRTVAAVLLVSILSGCSLMGRLVDAGKDAIEGRPFKNHVDLSDSASAEVATIKGETNYVFMWRIRCWMKSPANAKRVTINAGIVKIEAICEEDGVEVYANFQFEALAGHKYVIRDNLKDDAIELLDVTTGEVVVTTRLSCVGVYGYSDFCHKKRDTAAFADGKAIIKAGKKWCEPTTGQGAKGRVSHLYVDAGPISVDGICQAAHLPDFFGRRQRTANFDFIAVTGHIYTFAATEKECMRLLDITSEETVIACEPYELVKK